MIEFRMTLERGALLNNRYRIVEILGQGGMASIYRAIDENLGVSVAVKENLFTTEEYARQFRREAVILATLRHPNLPRVTDHFVIEQQGQYLVMDYIEGEDLRQRIDRSGVLTEEEVAKVGVAICEALVYLHSCQPCVLHRDIKPGNVKITPQGQVFLVDFGLAKVVELGSITDTGARAMTPGYSPPEQYGTARTDARSDIYSLGATLYSALTDTLPEDGMARAMDQVHLTPIRQYNPKVSRRLEMVIEKALEVRPGDRYQSAEDFRQDLLNSRSTSRRRMPLELILTPAPPEPEILNGYDPSVERPGDSSASEPPDSGYLLPVSSSLPSPAPLARAAPRRQRAGCLPGLVILLSILILITIAASFAIYRNPKLVDQLTSFIAPAPAASATSTIYPVVNINTTPAPDIFPEKSAIPTTTILPTQTQTPTALQPTPTSSPTPPLPTATALGGGSGQIGFVSNRDGNPQIYYMDMDGRNLHQVTDVPDGACQPSWSPDGLQVVFISPCIKELDIYPGSSLYIINVDGTGLEKIPSEPGGDYDPAWSPDGIHIAFTSVRGDGREKVFNLNLNNKTVSVLADVGGINKQPTWSPDGRQIAFVTTRSGPYQIWIMNADGSDPRLFSRSGENNNLYPNWSPDGRALLFTQIRANWHGFPGLYHSAVDAEDTHGLKVSPNESMPMRDGAYSIDGQWIAFETWQTGQNHEIYMMTTSGTQIQPLVENPFYDFDPAFRP